MSNSNEIDEKVNTNILLEPRRGRPTLLLDPELAELVGLNDAIFLRQLHFRLKNQGIKKNGRVWFFHSLEQWQAELPFFSMSTIRRTIASLKKQELIVTAKHLYRKQGRHTLSYAIDYAELERKRLEKSPDVFNLNTSIDVFNLNKSTINKKKSYKGNCLGASLETKGEAQNPKEKKEEEERGIFLTEKEKESCAPLRSSITAETAEEIIADCVPDDEGRYPDKALWILWAKLAKLNGYTVKLDVKDKQILKYAQDKVRGGGEDIKPVIAACLDHWQGFVKQAKREQGAYPLPPDPVVWFFHRYINSAVNFKREQDEHLKQQVEWQQAKQQAEWRQRQLAKQAKAKPNPQPEHKPATLEEVNAIMAAFK